MGYLAWFCTNPHALCGYFHNTYHLTKYFLELVENKEEKNGHYNMVIVEPRKEHKVKEAVDVQVVTR
jgi:hypothetical protein